LPTSRTAATWQVTGIVERMRTGEKARFETTEGIGWLIARMVACERLLETEKRSRQVDNGR
jgi:hypothetical protein